MSYHLRMLEKAGVVLAAEAADGRERRYRRAARSFQVRQGSRGSGASRVQLRTTVGIWLDTLTRAVERWVTDGAGRQRSEEHTSELQSRENLVCRLLLEKKNNIIMASA